MGIEPLIVISDNDVVPASIRSFDPLQYMGNLAVAFPQAMQILETGGVHPASDAEMLNPYTKEQDKESFKNIGEHCLAVACAARLLAGLIYVSGYIQRSDITIITERALVHDANKRLEVMRRKAVAAGFIDDAYSLAAYDTVEAILQHKGISKSLVDYMTDAGSETGHNSLGSFLILKNREPLLIEGDLTRKIIHLADDMTASSIPLPGERPETTFLTPVERMVASNFRKRYPWMWKEGLAFDNDGKVVKLNDVENVDPDLLWPESYAYWQIFIAREICKELQQMIAPGNEDESMQFIKDLVIELL